MFLPPGKTWSDSIITENETKTNGGQSNTVELQTKYKHWNCDSRYRYQIRKIFHANLWKGKKRIRTKKKMLVIHAWKLLGSKKIEIKLNKFCGYLMLLFDLINLFKWIFLIMIYFLLISLPLPHKDDRLACVFLSHIICLLCF